MRIIGYKELEPCNVKSFLIIIRNSNQWPLEDSWYSDYEVTFSLNMLSKVKNIFQMLSCPAVKFTDRFLIHGEFFVDESPAK